MISTLQQLFMNPDARSSLLMIEDLAENKEESALYQVG